MSRPIDGVAAALQGRYRVDREVGAGGMAIVYAAEDLKYRRWVAIKVLRDELMSSASAERFLREIAIAAQLQHPNILALLDSGESGGLLYYVMPLVDGVSLRARLTERGRLPVGEAVRIMVELADALAYAHAHGVVHRDIKPDNVMLSGRHALVTDFGVARAVSAATGLAYKTTVGIALGTPEYMSPEQAVADPGIDHRADIYSMGALAYELLAGRTPFRGESPQRILAAHVTETPLPLSTVSAAVSPALDHVVMKCLAKRPEDRWQSAGELLAGLESIAPPPERAAPRTAGAPVPARVARPWRILGAMATAIALVLILWRAGPALRNGLARNASPLAVGTATQFTADDGMAIQPDFSPDGRFVAYAAGSVARMRIFMRPISGGRTIALSDDSTAIETQPHWSPDGNSLLFLSRSGVRVAPALGGESSVLVAARSADTVSSAAWSPDGKSVAYSRGDSLFILPIGGENYRLVGVSPELHSCVWSHRDLIACVSGNVRAVTPSTNFGNLAPSVIVVFPAAGGPSRRMTGPRATNLSPVWSPDGATLYFVSDLHGPSDIYAVDIDRHGNARGQPVRVTVGLGALSIALAANQRQLAYSVYTARANIWSALVPAQASTALALTPVTSGNQVIEAMRVSRDGAWLVYDSNLMGHAKIYRIRLPAGQPERLTDGVNEDFRGDISPDAKEIAFHSFRTGSRDIYVQSVDGGAARAVTSSPAQEAGPIWSPDGRSLAFVDLDLPHGVFVVRRTDSGGWGVPVRRSTGGPGSPDWSPDGRSIVVAGGGAIRIAAADTGADRILYAPRPDSNDPLAEQVVWDRAGTTLYFKSHDAAGHASFWSMPATGGRPRLLARMDDPSRQSNRPDFAIEGRRLYFAIQARQSDIWIADVSRR